MVAVIIISILIFGFFLYAFLKVASDADDLEEKMKEKIKTKKGNK